MKLREIEVMTSRGGTVTMARRRAGIAAQTDYCRRREWGASKLDRANKLKGFKKRISDRKKRRADFAQGKDILREAKSGKYGEGAL